VDGLALLARERRYNNYSPCFPQFARSSLTTCRRSSFLAIFELLDTICMFFSLPFLFLWRGDDLEKIGIKEGAN
jgi:hypothetical protein